MGKLPDVALPCVLFFCVGGSCSRVNAPYQRSFNLFQGIYPLKDVFIRKVKLLKAPKFDISKLNEAHEGSSEDTGKKVSA